MKGKNKTDGHSTLLECRARLRLIRFQVHVFPAALCKSAKGRILHNSVMKTDNLNVSQRPKTHQRKERELNEGGGAQLSVDVKFIRDF